MADISQTAANVKTYETNKSRIRIVQVGEAVTQGMPGYLKASDGKHYKAVNSSAEAAAATGIFLTPAATDGYAVIQEGGDVDAGATLTVGETYIVSSTAGGIAPIGDLTTGQYSTTLGVAVTSSKLQMKINASGVAAA